MTTQQFEALQVPIERLAVSPINVRRNVGDISELTDSIREQGILEPLIVRPTSDDNYEVIIGSRRLAAASQLSLDVVPVVVQRISDAEAVIRSLVENLQRGELTLDERVEAYKLIEQIDGRFADRGELAQAIGRRRARIEQDFDAHEAMSILRPRGVEVISRLSPSTPQRRSGEAIPERHATLLEQAMSSVRGIIPEERVDETYAELARAIAPLEQDRARRLLDNFKMFPDRPTSELISMTLSTVQREITLPADTARQLQEMAEEQGERDWTDMIPRLVETQRETPQIVPDNPIFGEQVTVEQPIIEPDEQDMVQWGLPIDDNRSGYGDATPTPASVAQETPSGSESVSKPSRYSGVELPQDPVRVQQVNKSMWNLKHGVNTKTADFYTTGYSWKNIDEFIEMAKTVDVSTVVDIRDAPISQYKPDFSKDNLRNHLQEHGIAYIHRGDLGVPREVRQKAADAGSRQSIWDWYQSNVIENIGAEELVSISNSNGKVAFMCAEIAPRDCHRHLIHLALESAGLKGYDL